MVLWTALLLVALLLVWATAKGLVLYRTHRVLLSDDEYPVLGMGTSDYLGGGAEARGRLADYIALPTRITGWRVKCRAVTVLGECGPGALPDLLKAARSADPRMRRAALSGLKTLGEHNLRTQNDQELEAALILAFKRMTRDPDQQVRERARVLAQGPELWRELYEPAEDRPCSAGDMPPL